MMPDPKSLLPVAYRAASRVAKSRLLAEEAGERAFHLLTVATLRGRAPAHPERWLCVVARRSACALLRSEWGRTQALDLDEIIDMPAKFRQPRSFGVEVVREHMQDGLSPRQWDAVDAAMGCNTTRGAARCCGMDARDFRRSLNAISRKARRTMAQRVIRDRFADDAAVQFQLGG